MDINNIFSSIANDNSTNEIWIDFLEGKEDLIIEDDTIKGLYKEGFMRIKPGLFNGYTHIKEIIFNNCEFVGSHAFDGCINLTQVTLGKCETIRPSAFSGCTSLATLFLPDQRIAAITADSQFDGCPLESVYVPAEMVDSYKNDEGWKYWIQKYGNNLIKPLGG